MPNAATARKALACIHNHPAWQNNGLARTNFLSGTSRKIIYSLDNRPVHHAYSSTTSCTLLGIDYYPTSWDGLTWTDLLRCISRCICNLLNNKPMHYSGTPTAGKTLARVNNYPTNWSELSRANGLRLSMSEKIQ